MVRTRRLRRLRLVAGALWLVALKAAAQEPEPRADDKSAQGDESARWAAERSAVQLGHDGLALYEASRWSEAHERFQTAERLVHSPVFQLYMARCRRNMGRLIEAGAGREADRSRAAHRAKRAPRAAATSGAGRS